MPYVAAMTPRRRRSTAAPWLVLGALTLVGLALLDTALSPAARAITVAAWVTFVVVAAARGMTRRPAGPPLAPDPADSPGR